MYNIDVRIRINKLDPTHKRFFSEQYYKEPKRGVLLYKVNLSRSCLQMSQKEGIISEKKRFSFKKKKNSEPHSLIDVDI